MQIGIRILVNLSNVYRVDHRIVDGVAVVGGGARARGGVRGARRAVGARSAEQRGELVVQRVARHLNAARRQRLLGPLLEADVDARVECVRRGEVGRGDARRFARLRSWGARQVLSGRRKSRQPDLVDHSVRDVLPETIADQLLPDIEELLAKYKYSTSTFV